FLTTLESTLRAVAETEGDFGAWQDVLSILAGAAGARASALSNDLLQQARVMVGKTAERAQAHQRVKSEARSDQLRSVGQALITTFDLNRLMDVLAEHLPKLGIPSCYLSIYEEPRRYHFPDPAPEWSRLVLAYDERGR